ALRPVSSATSVVPGSGTKPLVGPNSRRTTRSSAGCEALISGPTARAASCSWNGVRGGASPGAPPRTSKRGAGGRLWSHSETSPLQPSAGASVGWGRSVEQAVEVAEHAPCLLQVAREGDMPLAAGIGVLERGAGVAQQLLGVLVAELGVHVGQHLLSAYPVR